ncbi:hypothetical protein EYF80_019432 [Liparis tanakae]|uniref:Uncharacterized protein n=1 Tax=Liparis tanakae TaxID=230148 RepID=A0A4Z2HX21_9TELE|nr:hypothetical protein EYF80_019432 [Liparis tanakae]
MLLLKPQHASPKQISTSRLPINKSTNSRCSGRTVRNRQTSNADGRHGGTFRSHCRPHCTEEVLEESHFNPPLSPCPPQPLSGLQAESESWEALLSKHRSKAEELERKVEQGQKGGVSLDATSVAQSSQYHFIQSKPDYHSILCRQQPMLHTMAMIMDTQSKMVRELLSIKEQSQLVVKETSGRLAAKAGFQDISPDLIKNLIAAPLSSATT